MHNTLTESFLVSYREFGPGITEAEADRFVVEQSQVGAMLGAAPLPQTAAELQAWVRTHPALAPSPGMWSAVDFLRHPPLPARQRIGYAVLMQGAISTMPPELAGVPRAEGAAGRPSENDRAADVPALGSPQQPVVASRARPLRRPLRPI